MTIAGVFDLEIEGRLFLPMVKVAKDTDYRLKEI
jgi:hypothetical protein